MIRRSPAIETAPPAGHDLQAQHVLRLFPHRHLGIFLVERDLARHQERNEPQTEEVERLVGCSGQRSTRPSSRARNNSLPPMARWVAAVA